MTIEIVSGPSSRIFSSIARTRSKPPCSVFGTFRTPSQSIGRKGARARGTAVIESAPRVVPWYAHSREMTLYRPSSPRATW